MKNLLRNLILSGLLLLMQTSLAQIGKLEEAMNDKNYKRAVAVAEKYMEDKELRRYPRVYYYHAKALYELYKDPLYVNKNPEAIKLAVKSIQKGLKKDEDSTVIIEFRDFIDSLAIKQNELAYDQYRINKMSKAVRMYEESIELNDNRKAKFMSGKAALAMEDTLYGENRYRTMIAFYNEDLENGRSGMEQEIDPFTYFINKHYERKDYDSAIFYLDNARAIFGDDPQINFYQKQVGLAQIATMPPSELMMEFIQKNLTILPTDEDFLHKENALYIHLIKTHIIQQRYVEADTLMAEFAYEKVRRSTSELAAKYRAGDDFVEDKFENVLWKLSEYYHTYKHHEPAVYVLNKYINSTASSADPSGIAARWTVIAAYAFETKAMPFASFVLEEAVSNTNNNTSLLDLRKDIISKKEHMILDVEDAGALYILMSSEYRLDTTNADNLEKLESIGEKYINQLVKNNRFGEVKTVFSVLRKANPNADMEVLRKYIAQEDFYRNYFLTKTRGLDQEGNEVKVFEWAGSINSCDAGKLDADIQEKVLNRINYFRRNAGVPEVSFDETTNQYCQEAALMMEANNKLDHEPQKSWRCYTPNGAYAARHSLLTKGANTTLAITSLMADQENPTVGNRRWLLYPNGKLYGHGSTNNIAVIWALDDSGTVDSTLYETKAICWPPNDFVPQLMLFKHWSFSIYQKLDSAQVKVKQDGKPINVKIEKLVEGYGIPTLVFVPEINMATLPNKSDFDVSITLSNGSKYSYQVRTFNYDPNKL